MRRSISARLRVFPMVGLGLTLTLAAAGPVSAVTTPLNTNLVVNPQFEVGAPAPDGLTKVQIRNWQTATNSNATLVAYGTAGGYPSNGESQRIDGKNQFAASGKE